MASLPYQQNLPVATNFPSQDVDAMTTNTNSAYTIWAQDHFTFSDTNPGLHKQAEFAESSSTGSGVIPSGLIGDGFETMYASIFNNGSYGSAGDLCFVRGASPTGIRLTGPLTPTRTSTFAGYTFLPGGFLLQWGTADFTNSSPGTQNFNFTTNFPNAPVNIQITTQAMSFPNSFAWSGNLLSLSTFSISVSSGVPTGTAFFWTAIGY
jgi:hypothetical protein